MSNKHMRALWLLMFLGLLFTSSTVPGQTQKIGEPQSPVPRRAADMTSPIDLSEAKTRFGEAKQLTKVDHGQLWGKSLDGPMLFVDPRTRFVVGNQPDAEGVLKPAAGVFIGNLPPVCRSPTRLANEPVSIGRWFFGRFRVTRRLDPSCSCTNRGTAFKPTWAYRRSIQPMPISTPCRVAMEAGWKPVKGARAGDWKIVEEK
jgi:hypothetical protein